MAGPKKEEQPTTEEGDPVVAFNEETLAQLILECRRDIARLEGKLLLWMQMLTDLHGRKSKNGKEPE